MSVLIIEDDAAVSHLIATLLQRNNLQTAQIFRGDEAFQVIESAGDAYEAIVLDLLLPVVSGFEILRHLRAAKPELLRRVIVVTAATGPALEKIRRDPASRAIITKPFDLHELLFRVLECVDAGRVKSSAAP